MVTLVFLCSLFFSTIVWFQMNTWQIIFHRKPCAFTRICINLYGLSHNCIASSWREGFHSKPTCTVHTHSSRPYCTYKSVLYYIIPFRSVSIHSKSSTKTDGHPVSKERRNIIVVMLCNQTFKSDSGTNRCWHPTFINCVTYEDMMHCCL